MTEKEQERWDAIDEEIDELQNEKDEIENAINSLSDYCEW